MALDDEDALTTVTLGVRVFQGVEQIATLDVEDDVLEPDAAIRLELRVLRVVPGEVLQCLEDRTIVCLQGTRWHRLECARECAQTRSEPGHPPANATHETNKKRA